MFFVFIFILSLKYFLIADCGSTATRMYAYQWDDIVASSDIFVINPDPPLSEPNSISIPLSSAVHDVNAITNIFTPLLAWAKKAIPQDFHHNTSFEFYGTSSMRQLTASEQRTIIKDTRTFLQNDGTFSIDKYAGHVLTTQEETVFLWIAMNTLLRSEISSDNPIGTIEIASQNANFAVNIKSTKGIREYATSISSPTISLDLFVPVFEGLGIDEIILNHIVSKSAISGSSTITSPCFLKGYKANMQHFVVNGEGDFDQCYSFISNTTLSDTSCSVHKCIFNSVPFVEYTKLYGLSTLDYTRSFFGLQETSRVSEYVTKGKEYCQLEWSEVNSKYDDDNPNKQFLNRYCIYAAYITNFLQRGLGVTDNTDLHVASKINDLPISYTLGAVLSFQQKLDSSKIKLKWYEILLVVLFFAVFVGIIIGIIVCCCIMKKKQEKMQNDVLLMRYQWDESDSSYQRVLREDDGEEPEPVYIQKPPEQQVADNLNDLKSKIGSSQLEIKNEDPLESTMKELYDDIASPTLLEGASKERPPPPDAQQMAEVAKDGINKIKKPDLKTPDTAKQQLQSTMGELTSQLAKNQLADLK